MFHTIRSWTALFALGALALGLSGPPLRSQDKSTTGGVDLLAGGDLNKNWFTEGNWKLDKDGVVQLVPRKGESGWTRYNMYLWAKQKYTDFVADFEYKVAKGGNSGFYFHVSDLKDPVKNGIEVQIYDSASKSPKDKLSDHDSGGIIPGFPPTKRNARPAGEWNHMVVTVKGKKVHVELNGETVNEVSLDQGQLGSRAPSGYIGFQDHGLPLALRHIKVRELK
jgi:hypothetical protein